MLKKYRSYYPQVVQKLEVTIKFYYRAQFQLGKKRVVTCKNVRFIFEQVQQPSTSRGPPIPPPAPKKGGWLTARRGRAARPRTLPVKADYVYVDGDLRPSCQYAPAPAPPAPAPAAPAPGRPSCSYAPAAPGRASCSYAVPAAPAAPAAPTPAVATPAPGPLRLRRRWKSASSVAEEVRGGVNGVRSTRNQRLVELSEVRRLIVRFALDTLRYKVHLQRPAGKAL